MSAMTPEFPAAAGDATLVDLNFVPGAGSRAAAASHVGSTPRLTAAGRRRGTARASSGVPVARN